jgi:serine/threonine-protein kinase
MSPEQAMGEREITARSDVYALGCVLYEMLIGDPPFTGSTAQAIVAKVVTEQPRSPTAQRHTIPGHLDAAVLTALEKLPADRFATAAEFATALANPSFAGQSATAGRATPAVAARALGWRAMVSVGVAALLLGVAGAKLFWQPHGKAAAVTRLMLEFPASQAPRVPSGAAFPILTQLRDGSGLLYLGPGASTRTQLWIRRWDRLDGTRLTQSLDEGCCGVFSSNGDSLAYLTPPHALQVVPLTGGLSTTVADSGLTPVSDLGGGVDWGSDGRLYVSTLSGLARVDPRGGKLETVVALDVQRGDLHFLWPAVLPDAHGALVTVVSARDPSNLERMSIGVADFRTGKVAIILQGTRAIYSPTGHLIFAKANGVLWAASFDPKSLRLTGAQRELADTVAIGGSALGDFSLSPGGALTYTKGVVQSYHLEWLSRNGEATPAVADLSGQALFNPMFSPDGKPTARPISG